MLNFSQVEQEILKFWQANKIFQKTLQKDSPQGSFVFFEGPPTANGKPGLHHVLARSFKDLIPRFKTMQGYLVERKAGWDTQGLPVELQVEKELGFKGKPDIEKYGVKEFNAKCKEDVWKYQSEWEKLTTRMGFWLDLDNPYITYDNSYIESLWWILQQVDKAGYLYQDYKVVPHCPRCGTSLSSHEVAQGYKLVEDKSVYVKFKVESGQKIGNFTADDNTYILSWTTTPWTLPGNVALAVGEDIKYVGVRINNQPELLILAADLVDKVLVGQAIEKVHEYKGNELINLKYEPLFNVKALQNDKSHQVYAADFVTTTDGTGVVHTAVMYGEDDFNLGNQVGLPKHHTVDDNGLFTEEVPGLGGQFVKDNKTEESIINFLSDKGLLFKQELYKHDYPSCWRCSTPLLYYAKPSWFIKMSALREDLKQANAKINWQPEHIKSGRFGEWLEGIKDWAISRERYWGTPLPIWLCDNLNCKNKIVIGSLAELSEKSSRSLAADFDVHRPFIDEVSWACKKCGSGIMKRVPEVADCWFDSGSMPFAQWGYPHKPKSAEALQNHYPADFIAEAIDQTRGWFYTLLAVATLLKKSGAIKELKEDNLTPPYKNVICLGHINDKRGQKMSKSKGNIVDPWEMIEKFGVDAVRWHFYTMNQPGEPKNFDPLAVAEVIKKNFLILLNVVSFYQLYSAEAVLSKVKPTTDNILDKWILALLQQLVNKVTDNLEKYEVTEAGRSLSLFINELSTWYVRRSRDRFKQESPDKQAAVSTLGYVLYQLTLLIAPFTPFLSENIYQKIKGDLESVHLAVWPQSNELSKFDNEMLTKMSGLRKIVELALAERAEAKIKIRQPLNKLTITGFDLSSEYYYIIEDEINVKEVDLTSVGELSVNLDTNITPELKAEGLQREFIRQINALRKKLKLTINDLVEIKISCSIELKEVVSKADQEWLKRSILAKAVFFTDQPLSEQVEVEGQIITVEIKK
ncbi:isoleucine--tRNA ligase [Patescibacteria group bacterium]|nr:isoleucine--tRNA ligase [Patescibacteria group bacterium]